MRTSLRSSYAPTISRYEAYVASSRPLDRMMRIRESIVSFAVSERALESMFFLNSTTNLRPVGHLRRQNSRSRSGFM